LGVVHRDVSAHNVFVTYDGNVKLVDFGVAKNVAGAHHTRPGTLKGKFAYMAPEQFRGEPVDRRADLFSAGVMLWEMLAGQRFWNGLSDAAIASRMSSELPLPRLPPDLSLPAGLVPICARALERDPARRYQTAAAMEADLGRVMTSATESYARSLGRVMSLTFAAERAERRALIERCLRDRRFASWSDGPLGAPAAPDAGHLSTSSGITRSTGTATVALEVRDPAPVAPPPRGPRGLLARVGGPVLMVAAGMAASLAVGQWIARHTLASRAAIASRELAAVSSHRPASPPPAGAPEVPVALDLRLPARASPPAPVGLADSPTAATAPRVVALALEPGASAAPAPRARSRRPQRHSGGSDTPARSESKAAAGGPGARSFDDVITPARRPLRARAIDVADPF